MCVHTQFKRQRGLSAAHLAGVVIDHLVEDGLQGSAGPAAGRGVQHQQQAVALVVQLAQRQLPSVPVRRVVKVLRQRGLAILLLLLLLSHLLLLRKSHQVVRISIKQ